EPLKAWSDEQYATRPGLLRHHHRRADRDAAVEVADVGVVHADAAIRDEAADRVRPVGAVDGIFAAGERHRGNPHRVVRRAARNQIRDARDVVLDLLRRRPGRVAVFAVDPRHAGPLLASLADANRIAHRMALIENEVKPALAGLDHDRGRRGLGVLYRAQFRVGRRRMGRHDGYAYGGR